MQYSKKDRQNLKMIITLSRCLQSVHRKESEVIVAAGITMPQFGVLDILYHKGPQKICTIIEKTLSTGGNMTVIIDNLEERGLVKRVADTNDRRVRLISITSKGEEMMTSLFPRHIENLQRIMNPLNSNEKDEFIRLAKKLGLANHKEKGE